MNFERLFEPQTIDIREGYLELAEELAREIVDNGQSHGRTFGEIATNSLRGIILEKVTADLLGGEMNTKKFDKSDINSYFYDIEVEGKKIEVKHHPKESWVNFNVKGNVLLSDDVLQRADYTTFLKHTQHLDFLIIGTTEKVSEYLYNVEFLYLINPKTFDKYMKVSSGIHKGTTNYYHHIQAMKDGQCLSFSKA